MSFLAHFQSSKLLAAAMLSLSSAATASSVTHLYCELEGSERPNGLDVLYEAPIKKLEAEIRITSDEENHILEADMGDSLGNQKFTAKTTRGKYSVSHFESEDRNALVQAWLVSINRYTGEITYMSVTPYGFGNFSGMCEKNPQQRF